MREARRFLERAVRESLSLLRLLAIAGTAIGFALCLWMLGRVIGFSSPWLVLQGMFCFMGVAKVAEPVAALPLPFGLRRVRPWERDGGAYRRLGVFRFGAALRQSPLRWLNASVYLGPGGKDLQALRRHAASAEATHFWAALLLAPTIAGLGFTGRWTMAALFLAVELLFNVYPILHLRALRGRLDAALGRARTAPAALA
jgi:hypothetical protein